MSYLVDIFRDINMKFLKSLILIFLVFLTSCKKDEVDNAANADVGTELQLVKIASWNSVTGKETTNTEFMYETNGRLKSITHNRVVLIPIYNSSGKITAANGLNEKGGNVNYTLTYNNVGQLVKLVYVFMNPSDSGYTRTFSYNASGKLVNMTTLSAATGNTSTVDYTWKGENLEGSTTTNNVGSDSSTSFVSRYSSYDNKLNPYNLAQGITAILNGFPLSKNNFTELVTTSYTGYVYLQKRVYAYHPSGYALDLTLSDGGNEGTKFYYNQ